VKSNASSTLPDGTAYAIVTEAGLEGSKGISEHGVGGGFDYIGDVIGGEVFAMFDGYVVYPQRWLVLATVCLLALSNCTVRDLGSGNGV